MVSIQSADNGLPSLARLLAFLIIDYKDLILKALTHTSSTDPKDLHV